MDHPPIQGSWSRKESTSTLDVQRLLDHVNVFCPLSTQLVRCPGRKSRKQVWLFEEEHELKITYPLEELDGSHKFTRKLCDFDFSDTSTLQAHHQHLTVG